MTLLYGSIIQIDGQFSDWDIDSSIFYFEDSISDTDGADLLSLSITNDENFLFIKIKLDREIDLLDDFENSSDIIIQIDADNNTNTGYLVSGIGSEYGIRCLEKFVYDNTYPGDNIEPLSFVQFRALPSITSDEFEIAIGRRPFGESIFNDTIAIVIKESKPRLQYFRFYPICESTSWIANIQSANHLVNKREISASKKWGSGWDRIRVNLSTTLVY